VPTGHHVGDKVGSNNTPIDDIDDIIEQNDPQTSDVFGLMHNKRRLNEIYTQYKENSTSLVSMLPTDQLSTHQATVKQFERAYKKAYVDNQRLLKNAENNEEQTSDHEEQTSDHEEQPQHIKLPEIRLPTFGGEYEHWISFCDKFSAQLGNNKALLGAQRSNICNLCWSETPYW
jgi:hypothetical protein